MVLWHKSSLTLCLFTLSSVSLSIHLFHHFPLSIYIYIYLPLSILFYYCSAKKLFWPCATKAISPIFAPLSLFSNHHNWVRKKHTHNSTMGEKDDGLGLGLSLKLGWGENNDNNNNQQQHPFNVHKPPQSVPNQRVSVNSLFHFHGKFFILSISPIFLFNFSCLYLVPFSWYHFFFQFFTVLTCSIFMVCSFFMVFRFLQNVNLLFFLWIKIIPFLSLLFFYAFFLLKQKKPISSFWRTQTRLIFLIFCVETKLISQIFRRKSCNEEHRCFFFFCFLIYEL